MTRGARISFATAALLALFAACRDFQGELTRCLDGGYCAERPDGADAGQDAGADARADAGADASVELIPCPDAEVCEVGSIEVSGVDLKAVAAVTPTDVWVVGKLENGSSAYLARCFEAGDSCSGLSGVGTNEDLLSVAANPRWVIAGGSEGRIIRYSRDAGAIGSVAPGALAVASVWLGANGNAFGGTQNATLFFAPVSGAPTFEIQDSGVAEKINGLWGFGARPTIAVGSTSAGAQTGWLWDGGSLWRRQTWSAGALQDIAGPLGHVYAVGFIDNSITPFPSLWRVDTSAGLQLVAEDAGAWVGDLNDVWVSSDGGHVFAIGVKGLIHKTPAGAVVQRPLPGGGSYDLLDVSGAEPGHLFIVGVPDNGAAGPSAVFHLRFNP